mmetsp:Transcript_20600/g.57446  ORF Transcript_20600/g.57446 Transcript_20600/m.57446 type:complete len:347 (-) Transcript_20600:36-1076(-)
MVVRHVREQVVGDVRVCYVVEHHIKEAVAAVYSGHGPPQPVPLLSPIVWQVGVGVLQQCDHHQPVVYDEVRHHIHLDQPAHSVQLGNAHQASYHHSKGRITDGHLCTLLLGKDGRAGVKVVGPPLIEPAPHIENQVQGPAQDLRDQDGDCSVQGALPQGRGTAPGGHDLGHKHLILLSATRVLVVAAMGVLPRIIRHQQQRVKDQANSIVQPCIVRECPMPAFMGNHPHPGGHSTLPKPVQRPQHEPRQWSRDGLVVNPGRGVGEGGADDEVRKQIAEGPDGALLKAVRRDGTAHIRKREWWFAARYTSSREALCPLHFPLRFLSTCSHFLKFVFCTALSLPPNKA